MNKLHGVFTAAVMMVWVHQVPGTSSAHTVRITEIAPGSERVVDTGSWYRLSEEAGWTFRPAEDIDHLELALYDPSAVLAAGTTPFGHYRTRTSGPWPDGPENEIGELGYEVSPDVLGDSNQHLYGKPDYISMRLHGGRLSSDSVYLVSFEDSAPGHIWLHPVRSHHFTMSAAILQSSEGTLTNPVYGPASVSRTILNPDSTRFEYTGLSPDIATGLKDDYPVGDYGQRPGSHGNGDFGWFPGYSLSFLNEGPGPVTVALFLTTGFTGPSGAPSNTLANDTFWKSETVFISTGEAATVELDLDDVQGYSLADNPFPHTAGDQAAPDGTSGASVNVFDRLQISAIGWEVLAGDGGPTDASLVITPRATSIDSVTSVESEAGSPFLDPGMTTVAPNPFSGTTRVQYTARKPGHVAIRVYDLRGRLIRTLADGSVVEGTHFTFWNGRDGNGIAVASGVYLVRMVSSGQEVVRKALVLRN